MSCLLYAVVMQLSKLPSLPGPLSSITELLAPLASVRFLLHVCDSAPFFSACFDAANIDLGVILYESEHDCGADASRNIHEYDHDDDSIDVAGAGSAVPDGDNDDGGGHQVNGRQWPP
eukprot:m.161535 g.161535  ORF g.161535 m.161535 type:complete len:118 (+) comp16377_c4_seq8:367-720(+)